MATDVADLLKGRFASHVARAAAFGAAAEVAYLAGFKAHDGGLDGLAQRYYLTAYRLAGETGEPGHQAFVLRILALQGTDIGERRFTVRLAERALAVGRGRCDPDTTALLQVAAARCHAESGDGGPALEMLRAAEPVLTADYFPDMPRWAAMWCSTRATLINQTAKAFLAVNEVAEAERHFGLAASMWDRDTHARVFALTATDVGLARWQLGDDGGAVSMWQDTLPGLQRVQSGRTNAAVNKIRARAPELLSL